jgi:hypothetical protein
MMVITPRQKWLRLIISGIVALLQFAVIFPNFIERDGVRAGMFIYALCLSAIPFLWISVFAGRNKTAEIIGWIVQFVLTVLILTAS